MRAGAALSALAHAALIAVAAWALPWLRARPEPPLPVIAVSFVGETDLAALSRRAAAAKTPPPEPAPRAAPGPGPAILGPRFVPREEPEPVEPAPLLLDDFTLAPSFDAASPLGFPAPAGTPPPEAAPPPDPLAATAEVPPDLGALRERHMRALSSAVLRARIYPPAARGRGLMGTARLYLEVARDGSLMEVGLMTSSGSASLDRAAVDAAGRARFPAAPEDLPGASFVFLQDLEFEAR